MVACPISTLEGHWGHYLLSPDRTKQLFHPSRESPIANPPEDPDGKVGEQAY
ncbi:hypothetical protein Cni_G18306 [Canna indica]|uniref:Uncharacterized protein n=1 Tax=Canna indica TaxID=4628 RepID=A0AAQ3QHJ8_9LILI|nr:hypothetical protein Cni_G18306 [Canna indica]